MYAITIRLTFYKFCRSSSTFKLSVSFRRFTSV